MFEKQVIDRLVRSLRWGRVSIDYWDGERRGYGEVGPAVTIGITTPAVARAALRNLSLAFGEGYMCGEVVIAEDELETLFTVVARNWAQTHRPAPLRWTRRNERNRRDRQRSQISRHYDVGNDYYRLFLDPTLTYSCAYFEHDSDSLEQAQRQKVDHLLRKLRLAPGQRLLDIGCGWGQLAVAAAKRHHVHALGITLSEEQLAGARALAQREGVADRARFELMNYQDLPVRGAADPLLAGPVDRVVSVGMFEHVGRGQHARYFQTVRDMLVDGGVSVLHTITDRVPDEADPWVDRYIFPGGYLPTLAQIEGDLAELGLWSIDRENLWQHYTKTLRHWRATHRSCREQIVELFDEQFYRMRDYWLAGSIVGFASGDLGLAQLVFTKGKPSDWPLTRRPLYA